MISLYVHNLSILLHFIGFTSKDSVCVSLAQKVSSSEYSVIFARCFFSQNVMLWNLPTTVDVHDEKLSKPKGHRL